MQSWGFDSRFQRRDTLEFPTKSGVTGMLCCALGAGGEQKELLARLSPMRLNVISFTFATQKGSIACPPLLTDLHMVGSGYNENDPWQAMHIPKTSEGKKAVGGGTKMTYRYYLQDARFAVIMEIPVDIAQECAEALQSPVWDLYLGRKNCVPSDFIFRGVFENILDAMQAAGVTAKGKNLSSSYYIFHGEMADLQNDDFSRILSMVGVNENSGFETITLNDVPLQFGTVKKYKDRFVTILTP